MSQKLGALSCLHRALGKPPTTPKQPPIASPTSYTPHNLGPHLSLHPFYPSAVMLHPLYCPSPNTSTGLSAQLSPVPLRSRRVMHAELANRATGHRAGAGRRGATVS